MGLGTVAIVGVGLIGGSVGLGLRQRGAARRVVGIGHRQASLEVAIQRGAVDEATTELAGLSGADLVILAVPVDLTVPMAQRVRPHLGPSAVLTDVGSTKRRIVERIEALGADGPAFVGGHPLAGMEKRGVAAATADLFEGATCVLTPTERTPTSALETVRVLWEALEAQVVIMNADAHDQALAESSHLPHVVAAALVGALTGENHGLAASGFLGTTRIASGDPGLWRAILQENREAVLAALETFQTQLAAFRDALAADQADRLQALLAEAKRIRDAMAG